MTNAAERPRSDRELEAREALMREEFERNRDAWEAGTPVEEVLEDLKAKITHEK